MQKRILLSLLLMLCLCLLTACGAEVPQETVAATVTETRATQLLDSEWGRTVVRNGKTWRYNSSLRTLLFMGVDSKASVDEHNVVGRGGRSDTMILFVLDPEQQTLRSIFLSRDTITEVDVYNNDQELLYSGDMQLAMQYAFGNSPSRSCQLSKRTVSELLLDLPITAYCSVTLDGITAGVELLGGLELTLEDDWTDIDPGYTAGATVVLDAAQTERFLRYRDIETHDSNEIRMKRHSWLLRQIFGKIRKHSGLATDTVLKILDPFLETDMDGDLIRQLTAYEYIEEGLTLPGHTAAGELHDEFYVDEEALKDFLLEIFYRPVD